MATADTEAGAVASVMPKLALFNKNPSGIQRVILQMLSDLSEGKIEVVDPTNAFSFLLESSAVSTASFMEENEANLRRLYVSLAQTEEDVYRHMADIDYVGRFSTPSKTQFSLMINKDDLLQKMVDDPDTGGRKITIPRNTEFSVADVTFSLQYPIDIKQLAHGGLQVVYDGDLVSPLQDLATNVIPFEERNLPDGSSWINFSFEVAQFKVTTVRGPLTQASGFRQNIEIADLFYYARVYYQNNSGVWKEIRTTHTDQVYDPVIPTAVLKLVGGILTVSIPQIYLSSGLLDGTLRVDVYETKGELNMILENYAVGAFSVLWKNIDTSYDTDFTAAMSTVNALPYSRGPVVGGSGAMTFEQLRAQVINNSTGPKKSPITPQQLSSKLEDAGYSVVANVDTVTNRVFLATRSLPKPADEKLITSGASSIETFITSIAEAVGFAGVKDNGQRITLTPELVYKNVNGVVSIYPKSSVTALLASPLEDIANAVTNGNFLYTPFHYVLDTVDSVFESRPYYLDGPLAKTVRFLGQNDTTGLQVNTDKYLIERTATGYKVTLVTKSNDEVKDLSNTAIRAQLSFIPAGEDTRAYLPGTYMGRTADNERIFEFDFSTDFDVTAEDNLILKKFVMFVDAPKLTATPLEGLFDVFYTTNVSLPSSYALSSFDDLLGLFVLPADSVAITREQLGLTFGYALKTLWSRARSVVGSAQYQRHTTDVPWLYEKDVYDTNPTTGVQFSIVGEDIVFTKLHSAGDPILDVGGQPTYRYRVGDIIVDSNNVPLIANATKVQRQLDIMFIEGPYFFATDPTSSAYRKTIVDTIVSWLTQDMTTMGQNLLEQTRLYFYPKSTMGNIKVLTDGGIVSTIEAGQYFNVDLFVTNAVHDNATLRSALKKMTISIIDATLKNANVSLSDITAKLEAAYGQDVLSFNITGLGGEKNLPTLTVVSDGARCNIRKRLTKQPDNQLIVEEDVTVNFIKHQFAA